MFSQVSLNTGAYPQIATAPHGHRAYVAPGGSGIVTGVNLTQPSTSVGLSTLSLTSGIVTATTTSGSTLTGLVPGIPTTVLISGVPLPNTAGNTTAANFNGVFSINVTSGTSFTYALRNTTASSTSNGGMVFYRRPNLTFGGDSSTTQGIAINPITHTAALTDADATRSNRPQIDILNQLGQSVNYIFFHATCTAFTSMCTV